MPTILRWNGLRIVIYPNDHRPAHVHVIGPGVEAVYLLHCPGGPSELRESFGFRIAELNDVASLLDGALGDLCAEWERLHDQ